MKRIYGRAFVRGAIEDDILITLAGSEIFIIPDVLCNAGGVTVSYFEWVQDIQQFLWSETQVNEKLQELITEHFNLTPRGIIRTLDLRRPIYKQTAAYGHFGRDDLDLPWEKTDKAEILRAAAGITDRELALADD